MARRKKQTNAPSREAPTITPMQAIKRIETRISEIEHLDPKIIEDYDDPQIEQLANSITTTLADSFGRNSHDYDVFIKANSLFADRVITMTGSWMGEYQGPSDQEMAQKDFEKGKKVSIATLKGAVNLLKERIEDSPNDEIRSTQTPGKKDTEKDHQSNRVFIVHGHDEASKQTIARFIEELGFEAIILHEQPNKGRTIIEKIEANSDVGFVIVLLTADDKAVSDKSTTYRARQNVILELGYFIGSLGREKVCVLKKDNVEIPSDMFGVVWVELDDKGAWKMDLAREMKSADYKIDSIPI